VSGCCFDGGGSGGGIRIDVGTLTGTGTITATGGIGSGSSSAGGGGGGRVAIYYQNIAGFDLNKITALGFTGSVNGGAGTVYFQGLSRETGEVIVDNNNLPTPTLSTPIINPASSTISLMHFRVKRQAHVRVDTVLNLSGTLEVATNGEFISTKQTVASTIDLNNTGVITHLPGTATVSFKVDLGANTLTIDATSRIDVNTLGFLGGSKPGNPFGQRGMTVGFVAGSSGSSGGGYGGLGGAVSGSSNPVYGDFRDPNEPGSGGATGSGSGGNGGGLVRIAAQNLILNGVIRANGGIGSSACCFDGGGSGGGIRIDVGTLTGTGTITATGGIGSGSSSAGGGGGGRVAIYYQNIAGFDLNKITALGFTGSVNGGAGTVYLQGANRETGELILDNNNLAAPTLSTPIINPASGNISLTHFRVKRQAHVRMDSVLNLTGTLEVATNGEFISTKRTIAGTIDLNNTGVITHLPTTGSASFKVDLSANTTTIDATSRIDVNTLGFLGGDKPGNPFGGRGMTVGFVAGSSGNSGGSYGGLGGPSGGTANSVYGDFKDPNEPGSGGATGSGSAGTGGGLVRIVAGTLQLNGVIRANGGNGVSGCCFDGGGSGGGIRIDVGTLSGTGTITANGGNGSPSSAGGGGGGRAAIYYSDITGFDSTKIKALGGTGAVSGQNGTVFTQQTLAMLTPTDSDAPVMLASLSMLHAESPQADLPQQKVFSLDAVFVAQSSVLSEYANRVSELLPSACCLTPSSDVDPIYAYDLNGNRTSMIDPTGLTTYEYDALNRLTKITNNKGVVTTFTYDALGRRKTMTHGNGVVTTYTYDAASQLLSLAHKLGATTINSFDYTYDKVGNRKTKVNRDGSHNYNYDTLNRLVEAINPLPSNPLENYTYDPVGNRTDSNQNGLSQFNVANELNEDSDFTYQYDNNGNMTRKAAKAGGAVTMYEYDAENKLVRVVMPGTTVDYKYDGLGRRVEKDVIGSTTTVTRYIYDNEDILLEVDGSNNIVTRYTHGPGIDEPLVMEKGGANFFYQPDGLGSITEITNQSGTPIQRYTYSSFGKIESQQDSNFVQPYTFTSREFDAEIDLYHLRNRKYDSGIGRFTTEDQLGFDGGINFYVYVGNNGINYVDPFGLFVFPVFVIPADQFPEFKLPVPSPNNTAIPLPPITYGNYGGKGWTGGWTGDRPPIDSLDECFKTHDNCYGLVEKGCSGVSIKSCDRDLVNCMKRLPPDPRQWLNPAPNPGWAKIYRTGADRIFR
jgi:RHS repeat-associated protein